MSVYIVKYENENFDIEILKFLRISKLDIVKFCILHFRIDLHNKYLWRAILKEKRLPNNSSFFK